MGKKGSSGARTEPGTRKVERGAAEEAGGVPLTESEIESSTRPPGRPAEGRQGREPQPTTRDDGSGMAGGASGGSGGGSGMAGHPDAAR